MMIGLIIVGTWVVGMLPASYICGRRDEDETTTVFCTAFWPMLIPIGIVWAVVVLPATYVYRAGERAHRRDKERARLLEETERMHRRAEERRRDDEEIEREAARALDDRYG